MPHEPAHLGSRSWEESRLYIAEELARLSNNVHALRGDVNEYRLRSESQREADITRVTTQREDDITWIREGFSTVRDRLATLDARSLIYGSIAGFIASGVMAAIIGYITRK